MGLFNLFKSKQQETNQTTSPSQLNAFQATSQPIPNIQTQPTPQNLPPPNLTISKDQKPIFKLEQPTIPNLPEAIDPKTIDVRYPLIPPYAYARIHWDEKETEMVYEIEEPKLTDQEKKTLDILEEGIKELINLSFISVSDKQTVLIYLEKNIQVLVTELSIELSTESYIKIMYYIYRDFVGLNDLEPIMNDYFVEDVECNGLNSPIYVVHRKYRNIRTSLIYREMNQLAAFVEKLAQKAGRYISYAEPLLDGSLPDGSRVNATYTTDVSSKGPTYCITDGYIQLSNGHVKKIDKLFEESKITFGSKIEEGNEIVNIFNLGCIGVEEKDLEQKNSKIKTIIKLAPPKKLVKIKLEDETEITTTTNHLFHIVDDELKLIEAEKLGKGMIIPLPNNLNVEGCNQKINIHNLIKEFSYNNKICLVSNTQIKNIINNEINSFNGRKEISEYYNVRNSYFYEIISRGNSTSFEILNKICEKNEIKFEALGELQLVVYGGGRKDRTKAIKIPSDVNEELAYIAGALISDGHLSENSIDISVYEEGFRNAVSEKLIKIFGKSNTYYNGDRVYLCNKFVPYLFNKIFEIPFNKKSYIVKIPEIIFKSNNKVIASFIKGLFDGDGTCKSGLSYKTYSKELVYGISYLLARLGIYCYIKNKGNEYKLNIPSIYENIFAEKIGFNDKRKQKDLNNLLNKKYSDSKTYTRHGRVPIKPVLEILKELNISKNQIIKYCNVSYNRLLYYDTISKPFLRKIISYIEERKLKSEKLNYLKWLINCEQEFVKVKEIEVFDNIENKPVYDIELEPCKFFIAGNRPMNIFDTIRKFTKEPWSPIQLMIKGTATAEQYAYLWMAVEYENSMMIIGGTGSGKTSFINTIAFFIPPQARVVSIEDTRELQLEHENWLPSVARAGVGLTNLVGQRYGEVSLFDLLRASFRQRPDYIIVGEVRGKEAFVLFQAFASGHPGMATMHAENVSTLIKRLETEPINLSGSLIETLAAVAVMSQTKVKGKEVRKLSSIDEIVEVKEGLGGEVTNNVFKWDPRTDTFVFNPNSKVFEKISIHFGFTKEQVLNEFKLRTKLLKELYKRGIIGFKPVQGVVHEYYKAPEVVLKRYGLI